MFAPDTGRDRHSAKRSGHDRSLLVTLTVDAHPWLERGANASHMRAPLVLGIRYEKGEGVPENHVLAAKWYQKGMDSGNAAAIRRLSEMYRLGMGVPHDEQTV